MKKSIPKAFGIAAILSIPCLPPFLAGCMSADEMSSGSAKDYDPFPRPQGPLMIPLEKESNSSFRYVKLDTEGAAGPAGSLLRIPSLILYIAPRTGGNFTYAFENPKQGYLVAYKDAPAESAGIYIKGTFKDSADFLDSIPVLWLPQNPKAGITWRLGPDRTMELVDDKAIYFTETLFPYDTAGSPVTQGFQRHTAYLFKEIAGDTVTLYHFRKGVGCLGFERSAGGRLLASGTIHSFYQPGRRL